MCSINFPNIYISRTHYIESLKSSGNKKGDFSAFSDFATNETCRDKAIHPANTSGDTPTTNQMAERKWLIMINLHKLSFILRMFLPDRLK